MNILQEVVVGEKFYFSGKPCKKGHDGKRYISENRCVECRLIQDKSRKHYRHAARDANRRAEKLGLTGRITREDILQMLDLCNNQCYYCEDHVDQDFFEIDHAIPMIRGGRNDLTNVVIACRSCNERKRHKTAEEFMIWLSFEPARELAVAEGRNKFTGVTCSVCGGDTRYVKGWQCVKCAAAAWIQWNEYKKAS
mgnify:CR=1 FL=1